MRIKYIYRIDDIHPAMLWDRFWEVMTMMEAHQVIPLLGVIPDNRDQALVYDDPNPDFASIIRTLVEDRKVDICQHGYQHLYSTVQNSVNQVLYGCVSNSEFAGLPYEQQYRMIKKGKEILKSHRLFTDTWMAPSHTNDGNTFRALKELGFKYITDGVALYPYQRFGLLFVPQQIWRPQREFPFDFGIFTISLHLNDLSRGTMEAIEAHLKSGDEIISFYEAVKLPRKWFYPACNMLYKVKRIAAVTVVRPCRNWRERGFFSAPGGLTK